MKDFKKLKVWEKGHELTLKIYKVSKSFPKEELYGFTSQMRRSASSVPMNIAEGCGRDTEGELHRFLCIAMGPASELEYQLILAKDLEYLTKPEYETLTAFLVELRKMMNSFIQKIKQD